MFKDSKGLTQIFGNVSRQFWPRQYAEMMELHEAVIAGAAKINHLAYRCHFLDREKRILFRYDNTPHFPELDSFPHHKHLESTVGREHEGRVSEPQERPIAGVDAVPGSGG